MFWNEPGSWPLNYPPLLHARTQGGKYIFPRPPFLLAVLKTAHFLILNLMLSGLSRYREKKGAIFLNSLIFPESTWERERSKKMFEPVMLEEGVEPRRARSPVEMRERRKIGCNLAAD